MARKKPIISPLGQWAYPGEVTIIPSSNITMKGVNYPVLGIDDLGNQQMMMPGQDYTFPGDYVSEIPQMGKGGLRQWFDEKWVDVKTGKACGRSGKDKNSRPYPACRPSKRVNETTPKTTSEMSSSEKAKFKREKTSGKRIDYNHKRREDGGETGWLDEYQTGGWASWTPNVGKPYMRTSPAGNTGYSDNTRVVNQNTNVSAANRKAAEAAEYAKRVGSVSQGEAKSAYEKAREASSFISQAERRKGSADPLDYVLDVFNPAAIGFAGVDLSNNLGSAVSNTAQGNFAEAGSDLLGAGLNALQIIPAAAEFKGIVKPLSKFARLTPGQYKVAQQFANNPEKAISQAVSYASKLAQSQINKNPRLALSLQRGRPISLDNVNTVSGIRYGDVSSVPNFNKIKPNTISEGAFFKQLEKGAGSLDNSLKKRVADLESEEGFRRLVEQEKDYLFYNSDLEEDALERVAKINARARIDELKNTTNLNKEAAEFASTNFLNAGIPNRFVETSQLYDNAFRGAGYDDVLSNMLSKRQGINLVKATPNYSKSVPGEIGIGYNYVGNKPIEMHEIAHSLQRGRRLNVDDQLRNIVPKKELTRDQKHAYEYFSKGSHRQEPSAFANELRESMLQSGIIPDYYSPISQQQIQDAYKYFKTKPMGTYNKNTGNFLSSTRILDFMAPNQSNSKLLSDILNKLPAVAPLAVGAAAVSQLPEQKNGGWLNNYQDDGENLPELNSKIDIANFYKNPLSEKYGIYQDPEDDTYKYYLKSGDESSILQSGPDLSNINSRRLAEINSQKGSLSNAQLANIKNVSPVILPEQKQRILRDKVYYDQEDLMEQAMSESAIPSVKTPSYSEILESDPEFKRVMTEKPKPVAPIKPKPVAADTPLVPIGNAPRAITRPAVRKVVAKNDIVNLADLTITKADLAYLNKVEEYCPKGNCLETTRNAYDMLPGRIQGIPTSSDIWSNDLKIHSKKGTPTANDIKQYPYFAGDSGSGTVDSWDIHGVIVANGGKNLFNINNPTPIDYKQIPVGAVIGWGPANKKDSSYSGRSKGYNKQFGMQPSHHSTMVTGYSETGEPIVYDGFLKKYMTLTEAKANIGSSLSYELENISAPKSILNNTQDNLRSQGILLNYIPPTNVNPNKILAAANQPWAQIPEGSAKRAPRFNKQMMTEFNSALMNNKGELMRNLNISSEKYDELAKVALAISAQESEGGGALGVIDGSTIGMTQLNPDNIFKDDKLKKAASKPYILNDGGNNILKPELIKTPSGSAVATMIYLSKLDKDSERYYNEGKVPKDRSFTKNSNIIKDALRSNTSKYNADGFFVEEANKRIDLSPFEGGMLSSPDPVAAQKLLNKTAGAADKYKVSVKNGSLVVTMKTKGNADLSVAERIGYAWQSPNTLKSGDAQGDSVYTRRIKNYYDLLNNTTPTYRKEGGQIGWLNKYK